MVENRDDEGKISRTVRCYIQGLNATQKDFQDYFKCIIPTEVLKPMINLFGFTSLKPAEQRAIAAGITDYFAGNQSVSKPMPDTIDVHKSKSETALSEHFDKSEFACHHCGQCINIHPRLIELFEQLRKNIGRYSIHINNGY